VRSLANPRGERRKMMETLSPLLSPLSTISSLFRALAPFLTACARIEKHTAPPGRFPRERAKERKRKGERGRLRDYAGLAPFSSFFSFTFQRGFSLFSVFTTHS
jgi:hypothetical protein